MKTSPRKVGQVSVLRANVSPRIRTPSVHAAIASLNPCSHAYHYFVRHVIVVHAGAWESFLSWGSTRRWLPQALEASDSKPTR